MTKIDEGLAKRNKENMSFSDYKEGSATAEYNAVIANATAQVEAAKERVSDEGKERLDNLLAWYSSAYAKWTNKRNANGAGHVSSMISGPANYNMRKHEKFLNREGKLWEEYDQLKDIGPKISAIVRGDKTIKSDDADAIQKLKDKLQKAQEKHQAYKDYNAKARKEGRPPLDAYVLSNSNGRMKSIRDRIARLERLAKIAEETPQIETEINGITVIDNIEAHRLQIIFPGKPDKEVRTQLKKNGFRWSPTNGAWQAHRSYHAEARAREILEAL